MEKTIVTGNNVRIISDPQIDTNISIISVKDSTYRTLLPSLGYTMIAEIEKSTVDILDYTFGRNKMVS